MLLNIKKFFSPNPVEKIHWFSGINNHNYPVYLEYIEMYIKAVISQIKTNQNVQPYLIFDGEPDDHIDYLESKLKVIIIPYKVSFYNKLMDYYKENYIAAGAFLRCDIPLIVKDVLKLNAKYVLYTDNDILFMSDISKLNKLKPKFFNISSEFSKNKYTDINSGVMWINIENMYNIYPNFRDFIINNFDKFQTYDQDAIKFFFKGKWDFLDFRYNYKPYFGKRNDVKILHFHGPKPLHLQMCKEETYPMMNLVGNYYFEMVDYYNKLSIDE